MRGDEGMSYPSKALMLQVRPQLVHPLKQDKDILDDSQED